MAHCPFDQLADLADCLDEIRSWPAIREPKPGIFYLGRIPFLHFHSDRAGRRWADVRSGRDWGPEIDLPFGSARTRRRAFLRETRRRYRATAERPKG